MIKLKDYEKRMLRGEFGEFKQKALEFIVNYAKILGAKELIKVDRATLFIGAQHYLDCLEGDDYEEIVSKFFLNSEKKILFDNFEVDICQTCSSQTNTSDYKSINQSKELFDKDKKFVGLAKDAGVSIVNSCTPYYTGWVPVKGEVFVTTESSNVVMSNSLFGAYGNAGGIESSFCAAVCGRTPLWGNLIKENRNANVIFNIHCPSETLYDWDIIGYTMGRLIPPNTIPVINEGFKKPNVHKLRQLFASIATTSATELCHIVGITPEARTLEDALGENRPIDTINVTIDDYNESIKLLCNDSTGEVDLIIVGCPHIALEEIKELVDLMDEKKVKKGVEFWVFTDYSTKSMSDFNGYTRKLENTGIKLLDGACPVVFGKYSHACFNGILSNSAKQAHAISSQTDSNVYFGDIYKCIEVAMSGKWGE